MELKSEDSIEFLEQNEFKARKIIVVGQSYIHTKGGQKHNKDRCYAKNAYCYEEVAFVSTSKK